MHCWFRQWMSMSDVNFSGSFWIFNKRPKAQGMRHKLARIYLSCFPGSLVVWTRWNPQAYPDERLGGSTPIVQKYCPSCAAVFMKSKQCTGKRKKLYSQFHILLQRQGNSSHRLSFGGSAPGTHWRLPSARSTRSVPFYTIHDPPLVNLPIMKYCSTTTVKPITITIP